MSPRGYPGHLSSIKWLKNDLGLLTPSSLTRSTGTSRRLLVHVHLVLILPRNLQSASSFSPPGVRMTARLQSTGARGTLTFSSASQSVCLYYAGRRRLLR